VQPDLNNPVRRAPSQRGRIAFTVTELLVVMGIIALLATIGIPAMKGLNKGQAINGATRQVLDDLALARLSAIKNRTPVYMVFVPTNVAIYYNRSRSGLLATNRPVANQMTSIVKGAFSSYALVAQRRVGDQPGRGRPRYLTDWKQLPQGVVIPPYKFVNTNNLVGVGSEYTNGFSYLPSQPASGLPFPDVAIFDSELNAANALQLPVIAFNADGQLLSRRDEIIPLAEGGIMSFFNTDGSARKLPLDEPVIKPANNWTNNYIRISWLTGRARLEKKEMR